MLYVGIDPGQSGAIVAMTHDLRVRHCLKMPESERDIFEAIWDISNAGTFVCAIERLHAMPAPRRLPNGGWTIGRNPQAAWSLAWNSAACLTSLIASGAARIERPTPKHWQRVMGCRTGGNKDISKQRAQELFPDVKITLWNADALLLAEYARRVFHLPAEQFA